MIISRAELEATKMQNLKIMIVELGGEPSTPGETKENLIERIILKTAEESRPREEEDEGDENGTKRKKVEQVECTMEEVLKAVNSFILRGMKVYHNEEDKTWMFRVQIKSATIRDSLTGTQQVIERWRDDSGTLKQPLSTIKRCASLLMQNAKPAAAPAPVFNPIAHQYKELA